MVGELDLKKEILLVDKSVRQLIKHRLREFSIKRTKEELFSELCFCILAANYTAEGSWRIQKAIGEGFLKLSKQELSKELKGLGYRFPNIRASFIVEARRHLEKLPELCYSTEEQRAREWLVSNVKGIGMKEASHFLRNTGAKNLAILDMHVLRALERAGIACKPKTLTKKKYLAIEEKIRDFASELELSLAELDLLIWYVETGKVLK